ncbi:hypothetical protein SPBR_01307 [Sporothrix brasiliensis 5110]|uniref:Zn(2)-C6 fungal-type domain-containing protein n=1 Tax=Sporothrix brasiliensis 5110 TaxID=1398154 RepID=A0A0C2FL54_9PEZI|nr:uncharacterized protein SPBR_01307 [Sporothrix brasiliensis 5110]KIH91808.1 hypothetical protein SPBR_01307 [Sporothrix brasiliensis 5110]
MSPTAQTASHEAQDGPERHPDGTADESSETRPETPADQPPPTTTTTETGAETSCLGCRRRKLKCSRDLPSCAHCQRLDVACAYDTKKAKPGLRPGAIEALSQRIEVLENALAGRQTISPVPESNANGHANTTVVGILALLAQELQKLNAAAAQVAPATATGTSTAAATQPRAHGALHIASPSSTASSPMTAMTARTANGYGQSGLDSHGHSHRPRKRQRMVDSCGNPDIDLARPLQDLAQDPAASPGLPPPATLQAVVNAYFVAVQPWIPVLHETQFRRRMHDPAQRPQLTCLLHAMVVAAARYVQEGVESAEDVEGAEGAENGIIDTDALLRLAARSRSHVLLTAMDALTVENLQALIILAFHDIGSGRTARAWSIVASLTRTVDYLGLNTEAEDDENSSHVTRTNGTKRGGGHKQQQQQQGQQQKQNHTLLHPMSLLSPPSNWIEEEERRRVFWCVLLLDRFCSVGTGWTTGLAAADVHRRLPADGFFFHKDEPVLTPYMYGAPPSSGGGPSTGDVDRARDREVRDRDLDRDRERDPADPPVRSPASTHVHGHNTNVGALAYCIEAAESLSRVVSTFLRQSVDFGSRPDVSRWLTRFKELDLQLVHWKMYLPQRWRDSNVSRQPARVNMDPNLTLAHITHNTSTLLLHQRIAYPDAAWWAQWTSMVKVKLPSVCSAETCQNAAIETAAITSKYLRFTPKHRPVASQFAFCVYISARVLLLHGRSEVGREVSSSGMTNGAATGDATDVDVLPEFFSLLRSLEDMDRRWLGSSSNSRLDQDASKKSTSLAGHYAQHLKDLYRQCLASPSFVVDVLGYTEFEPDVPSVSEPVPEPAPPAIPLAPTPVPAPAPTHPQQQMAAVHPSMHTMNQPNPASTWPMQPLDQLSPVMTYHQHAAQAHAMADNSASAYAAASVVSVPTGHTGHTDDLTAISHLLLDQQFMDRDRVISFEDSFFAAPGRWT